MEEKSRRWFRSKLVAALIWIAVLIAVWWPSVTWPVVSVISRAPGWRYVGAYGGKKEFVDIIPIEPRLPTASEIARRGIFGSLAAVIIWAGYKIAIRDRDAANS